MKPYFTGHTVILPSGERKLHCIMASPAKIARIEKAKKYFEEVQRKLKEGLVR